MPIGCYTLVPHIAHHLCVHRPRRVLDLGIGFGFYGAVVRQWLDGGVRPWSTYLAGVEAWPGYRNPLWDLYDRVSETTIQCFLADQREQFDCIVLTDVIEHFAKEEGAEVLRRAYERLAPGGWLLVGTPAVHMEQGAAYGNEFERHRSLWGVREFSDLGFQLVLDGSPDTFGNQMLLVKRQREDRLDR